MATIRKRSWTTPSGAARTAWIVSYSAGKKRHIKTFRAKKDAEAWRSSTMVEIARGTHVPTSASVTVAKAAERWLEQWQTDGLEKATQSQYEQHVRLHILPLLGSHRLAELNSAAVDDFRNLLINQQRKSRPLVAKVLTSLGAILAAAQRAGWASHNVVREQARLAGTRQRKLDKRHDKRLEEAHAPAQ
jgi:integrase